MMRALPSVSGCLIFIAPALRALLATRARQDDLAVVVTGLCRRGNPFHFLSFPSFFALLRQTPMWRFGRTVQMDCSTHNLLPFDESLKICLLAKSL
ncbi:hypothetical protein L218DRAFT_956464 [Marasmius fiardii PR-910]|nr:hypothetical protein L218DRAFT_956464 [Marasmius fiardii PR-910]